MKTNIDIKSLTVMGFLTALVLLFSFTPIGTIPIGPLSVTLNVIPIALAAVTMGPIGGAAMGAVFGLMSFLQCLGIGVLSPMGEILFNISPILAFVQRFLPRVLVGFLAGLIYKAVSKFTEPPVACAAAGFSTAFLNTALFMSALVLLFGNTDYVLGLVNGRNILVFICAYVGVNALVEMAVCTLVTCAGGTALIKARLINREKRVNG